jgi:hypothetical protein
LPNEKVENNPFRRIDQTVDAQCMPTGFAFHGFCRLRAALNARFASGYSGLSANAF